MKKPGKISSVVFIFLIIFLISFVLAGTMSCVKQGTKPPETSDQPVSVDQGESPYAAAEALAKRLVLYTLAVQENELASITAMPESYANVQVPELAKTLNEMWWSIDWPGAHLKPLEPAEITSLETTVFPLMTSAIEDKNDENGWVLIVLSFDSELIKRIVSQAHEEWEPDQQTLYLGSIMEDCMQVWCIKVKGEWKILAHFDCQPDVTAPERPEPPADLFKQEDTETGAGTQGTE